MSKGTITPPDGGRIIRVSALVAQLPWRQAILRISRNQDRDASQIWTADEKNPATEERALDKDFILLSYPCGDGSFDAAISWAKENRLRMTVARDVFAIGARKQYTRKTFGAKQICTISASTTFNENGSRSTCNVWWSKIGRGAGVMIVDDFNGQDEWIAFVEGSEAEGDEGL